MRFWISPQGELLHELCHYHNHKTVLFYCIFLDPFRLCVGIDPLGMQLRVCSLWLFEIDQWHILGETVMQQVVLPEAIHLPSKLSQWDNHNCFSSGLLVLSWFCLVGVFLGVTYYYFFLPADAVFHWGFSKRRAVKWWIRSVTQTDPRDLQVPGRARDCVDFQACASSLLCSWSHTSLIFSAANPTEALKSFPVVMEHINHNSKEKVTPWFVVHSIASFLLSMEYAANILHSHQNERFFSLRAWMKNT